MAGKDVTTMEKTFLLLDHRHRGGFCSLGPLLRGFGLSAGWGQVITGRTGKGPCQCLEVEGVEASLKGLALSVRIPSQSYREETSGRP